MNLVFVTAMVFFLISSFLLKLMMGPLAKAPRYASLFLFLQVHKAISVPFFSGRSLAEDSTIVDEEKAVKRLGLMKNKKKRRIIACKSKSHEVRFKPNFEKKQSEKEPKLVYMAYIAESSTVVLFSNIYHTFKSNTRQASAAADMPTRLFGMKLPQSSNNHTPRASLLENEGLNIRVGFGFVPSTQAYKVARFFYRSFDLRRKRYSMGFEVFTLGISKSWRVLAHDPPYPIHYSCFNFTGKCIYFYIWHLLDPYAPNAFLCFNLRKDKFSVLYPPYCLKHVYVADMMLTNLQGKLCLSVLTMNQTKLTLFTSKQGNNLDWMHTFSFNVLLPSTFVSFSPLMEYAGQLLIHLNDSEKQRLLIYHTNNDGSVEEVEGELEDVNMQKLGFSLIRNKPWFYVSPYEESLQFKLRSLI